MIETGVKVHEETFLFHQMPTIPQAKDDQETTTSIDVD
jgi:hypothetical protein